MNPWDEMADIFGSPWDAAKIPECAADNILIAWPSMLSGIRKQFGRRTGLDILDFGCGGGHFCRQLHALGHGVTGYEQAEMLLQAARINVPREVKITASEAVLDPLGRYDLITAIMVIQFVLDIEPLLQRLLATVNPGGLLLYSVFNPRFTFHLAAEQVTFTGLQQKSDTGFMELKQRGPGCPSSSAQKPMTGRY
jgi:2-polyprenyl-3-methyl-5-hydroxy-6-metoxy-1,4-benzoquinol methylase